MAEFLGPLPGSNYMPGRQGRPISLIVDHWMVTTTAGADSHFHNPNAGVSAHYGVSQDGRIVQWVKDEDTAYHCGHWNTNLESIGIEHECGPEVPPTEAMYAASAGLHAALAARYGIALEVGVTVVPHKSVSPTQCPGTLDLARLVQEEDVTPEQVKEIVDAAIKDYGARLHLELEKDRRRIDEAQLRIDAASKALGGGR